MSAKLLYHSKVTLVHKQRPELAIAELKIWSVPESKDYPEGLKFSLFLVSKASGEILIGIDNHKPKGPHLHLGKNELPYVFRGNDKLVEDFWKRVRKEGFEP